MHIDAAVLASLLELDLVRAGWDGALSPYPGIPLSQFAMQSLRKSLLKKYLPGTSGTTKETDKAALSLFLEVNERCGVWKPVLDPLDSCDEVAIGEAKAFLYDFFYPDQGVFHRGPDEDQNFVLCWSNIYRGLMPGPGSTIGTAATDFYSKFATSRLSSTSTALYEHYREAISFHPTWTGLERCRKHRRGVDLVSSSRLSFVPKTTEISRTICTEPLLNMLFQKGIGRAIEDRLRECVGLHLSRQPEKNAFLAQIGSQTGRFGTIDLQSASDSLSLHVLDYMFPSDAVSVLRKVRTPVTTLPGGKSVDLHMVSSMGNAFTFPLQTLLFTAVVYGVYRALSIRIKYPKGRFHGNFGVFGDDIVVEQRAYERVVRLLTFLGFTVNVDKSFNVGTFRESCGSDYFQGYNVRGVYFKRLADSGDLFSATNRLVRWCSRTGIYLPRLIEYLISKVPRREQSLRVPFDEADDAGIKVPFDCLDAPRHDANGAVQYRYRRIRVRRVKLPYDEKAICTLPDWFYNPDGLVWAAVAGTIRNGYLSLRILERHANIRRRYTPRWDYIDSALCESIGSRSKWKTAARILTI